MDMKVIVRNYTSTVRPNAEAELRWFREQPTLKAAIEKAALATNSEGERYSHQRRLSRDVLEDARSRLLKEVASLENATSFDDLLRRVNQIVRDIRGIGELYVYDTSLRIGSKLELLPDKVYLHAGTRSGAKALSLDHRASGLALSSLPAELRQLQPHEIEDVLCIYKDDFDQLDRSDLIRRSWCG